MNKNFTNKITSKLGFEVHGRGYMQQLQKSTFKDDPFEKQKEILGKADVILDIGANRGDTVLKYKELFPSAKVHAFEPFADTFNSLVARVQNIPGVFPHELAISDLNGESIFYVNKSPDCNSLLPSRKSGMTSDAQVINKSKVIVNTSTLDAFVRKASINKIDILKLDIQGGELDALRGAERLLSAHKVSLIFLEMWFVRQYEGAPLYYDVIQYLSKFGYDLQDMYDPYYSKGSLAWCDAIFLPRNQKPE